MESGVHGPKVDVHLHGIRPPPRLWMTTLSRPLSAAARRLPHLLETLKLGVGARVMRVGVHGGTSTPTHSSSLPTEEFCPRCPVEVANTLALPPRCAGFASDPKRNDAACALAHAAAGTQRPRTAGEPCRGCVATSGRARGRGGGGMRGRVAACNHTRSAAAGRRDGARNSGGRQQSGRGVTQVRARCKAFCSSPTQPLQRRVGCNVVCD
jgi:hypothetical protein